MVAFKNSSSPKGDQAAVVKLDARSADRRALADSRLLVSCFSPRDDVINRETSGSS